MPKKLWYDAINEAEDLIKRDVSMQIQGYDIDGDMIKAARQNAEDAGVLDVCRHTYCSNMARAGMNPKTLQYLMGHSDIGVTMNTYTHLGLEDAQNEMVRLEELNKAKEEVAKAAGEKRPVTQRNFRAV